MQLGETPMKESASRARSSLLKQRNVLLMIVLTIVTLGFYYPMWFLRRRAALNLLDSPTKIQKWPFLSVIAFYASRFGLELIAAPFTLEELIGVGGARSIAVAELGVSIVMLVHCFRIKDILQDHLDGPAEAGPSFHASRVQLSGLLTFFFQIFYLQHVINRDIVGRYPTADAAG